MKATPALLALLLAACKDDGPTPDDSTPPDSPPLEEDLDGDGFFAGDDCNDADPAVHPGADEVCDGLDNDCDLFIDDEDNDVVGADTRYFRDADRDGYGDEALTVAACSEPAGYVTRGEDCDDDDARVNPGQPEVCGDGVDNDCEGEDTPCNTDLSAADARLAGVAARDRAGVGAWSLGDVSGDGVEDFAVSASLEDSNDGAVYVYLEPPPEGTSSLADAPLTVSGRFGVGLGRAVAAADFDGDGVNDLWASAHRDSTAANGAGALYLFRGPLAPGALSSFDFDVAVLGEGAGDRLGAAMAAVGDLDGDGSEDLFYSAYLYDHQGTDNGVAYLTLGPITGPFSPADADVRVLGSGEGDQLGSRLGPAGDMNGDGLGDLLVASRLHDSGGADAGAVWVVPGLPGGSLSVADLPLRLDGAGEGDQLGSALAPAGDVNADGYDDILLGALSAGTGGEVYLVLGPLNEGASVGDRAISTITAEGEGDQLGATVEVSAATGAIALGANRAGDDDAGAVYLFHARPPEGVSEAGVADLVYPGEAPGDYAGSALALPAGPDGRASLLIGASARDEGAEDAGVACLFLDPGL